METAAITFVAVTAAILTVLLIVLYYLERRQKQTDELEEFRRTIEAMRRLEQQDGDR